MIYLVFERKRNLFCIKISNNQENGESPSNVLDQRHMQAIHFIETSPLPKIRIQIINKIL